MKKRFSLLFVILAMVASGAAGFGGTYLATNIINITQAILDKQSSQNTNDPDWNASELNAHIDEYINTYLDAYIDAYLASQINTDGADDIKVLNSFGNTSPSPSEDTKPSASQYLTIPEISVFASNSIVEIYTETVVNGGRMGQFISEGAGSGVVFSSDGYIVTNNHVIENSRKITVRLYDGTDYEATLIGADSKTDLAVLKIEAYGLHPVIIGDSDSLVVGELAVAIGNPLGKLGGTISEGIISALSRNIDIDGHMMTLLQTTAAVNPGNSGGGLFNGSGELIGVVNAKSSGSDIEGIGFAIPVNLVRSIADDLIQNGYVPGRIDFGASLINVLDSRTAMLYRLETTGVYVSQTDDDSPLQVGDRIISINGIDIARDTDVKTLLEDYTAGDVLSITVARSGNTMIVDLTLKQALS